MACVIDVFDNTHVIQARHKMKEIAKSIGFSEVATEELCIIVSELGTNIVKYAQKGRLIFFHIHEKENEGILIKADDYGPQIVNIEQAMMGGFSTGGTLGQGLGAINRLSDEICISPAKDRPGNEIRVKKMVYRPNIIHFPCPFEIGVASHVHPTQKVNGDAFVARIWDNFCLVGIIDGLGHGDAARAAAKRAQIYIESHFRSSIQEIFNGANRACMGTRGVVLALLLLDWENKTSKYAMIGNIGLKVTNTSQNNIQVRRGVVGLNPPSPIVNDLEWNRGQIFILYTDGIRTHYEWDKNDVDESILATNMASKILQKYDRMTDDATIMVIKERSQND